MADATPYDFPGGDVYLQAQDAANTAYQTAVAKLNQNRSSTLNQYGYLGDVDPSSGAIGNVRVDPNNPYGLYQQLLKTSADSSIAAHDDAAGRGLSGGLAQQGETAAKYQYGAGASTLGGNLQNTLGGYDTNQLDAENTRDQTVSQDQEEAAAAALQYQLQQAQLGAAQSAVNAAGGGGSSDDANTQAAGIGGVQSSQQLADLANFNPGGSAVYQPAQAPNAKSKPISGQLIQNVLKKTR